MRKRYIVIPIAALMLLIALSAPALASYNFDGFPVTTRTDGTVHGGVFIDYVPWAGTTTLTGNFNVPSGAVKWAYLYTGIWGGKADYEGWVNVRFNGYEDRNGLGPINLRGKNDTNPNVWCSGNGKYWMFYNVTDLVNTGSTNTATTTTINATAGSFDGRVYGIVLVVVYEGGDNPKEFRYWINDGSDALNNDTPKNDGTTYFEGTIDIAKVTTAHLTMVHLTAYSPIVSDGLKFNGNPLDTSMIDSNTFELNSWDVTDYVVSSGNNALYSRGGDEYVSITNAILVLEREAGDKPDLIVSDISSNCGYLFANESNEIRATIKNNGTGNATAFNVSFNLDGFREEVRITGLAAGANTSMSVTDPSQRNAGDSVSITVTVDCDTEVSELNETNNVVTKNMTVVNNGYKGKRYTGGSDITTWKTLELNGNLLYSTGDSYYLSGSTAWKNYTVNWSASDLPVPGTATVKEARLYVPYTWDKVQGMPDNVSMKFNNNPKTKDAIYTDRKEYGSSDYPYGMLAYNVTGDFNRSGNTAVLQNLNPVVGNPSIRGMLFVVVYADGIEPSRKIIMNEEFDLLYGGSDYCTTSAEATVYAPFGAINLTEVEKATLITIAPGAGPNEGELIFNGHTWNNVWNYGGKSQIGINETAVTLYLNATGNEAGFQSSGDWMEASNAILVLKKPALTPPYLVTYTISNRTITPPQTTEIDVKFSERVEAWIKIEDSGRNPVKELYHSTSVIDPEPKMWNGTYTNGTQVPDGNYYVNVTGTNITTGLSVINNTEIITVTAVAPPPTADWLGVQDASGRSGTYVWVPVNLANVRNASVLGIRLRVDYNESVLNLTNVTRGDLTVNWTALQLGVDRHTITIGTGYTGDAIPIGRSGSVVLLNFHVIGSPEDASPLNMTLIELSNPDGIVGTAPAKNGTFVVPKFGTIVGRITYACNGTGIVGAKVNLTKGGIVVNTTMTNATGYYNFTGVIPASYVVNASKLKFWDNSTPITVIAGETVLANMMLWLKGDSKNDGIVADAGDVVLMLRASVGDISGDMHYDLNGNSKSGDAGDVVLMLRASVGDIELL